MKPLLPKTVFVDFDGTYADRGRVPDAHVRALREARANGHRVLLCTGRSRATIAESLNRQFDGFVGAAGGYVDVGGKILRDIRFPRQVASRALSVLTSHSATFVLEAPEAIYAPPGTKDRLREEFRKTRWSVDADRGPSEFLDSIVTLTALDRVAFGKISVFHSTTPIPDLAGSMGPEVASLPNSVTGLSGHAGEIYLRGITKAEGMAEVASHLQVNQSDTVAIGDSYNDIEMLRYAGTAVVVENSPCELLDLADLTIPGPDREGVVTAFVALGLIGSAAAGSSAACLDVDRFAPGEPQRAV